jgi:two-component system nitrogen regulation sensor histidine kinase NtrY
MGSITHAFRDYQALQKFKNPIRESYLLLFLMITLIIIFGAVWFGIYLARKITEPIGALEKATEEVARGNLSVRVPESGQDEFALLIRSFNQMTEDLADSNRTLQEANSEMARRREYTETILEHIGTGVISIDREGVISTVNRSAEDLLSLPRHLALGKTLEEIHHPAVSVFRELLARGRELDGQEVESSFALPEGQVKTFRIRSNRLSDPGGIPGAGVVIVFDDITALLMAQKAQTWREVAQRVAHEIKNPLTPIQLSAQRLQKKFLERSEDFPRVFQEAIQTIVDEVQSMKHLVDEFSSFARIPGSNPQELDIVSLLSDISWLYRSAHKDIEIVLDAPADVPLLVLDKNAIRRVFVNLFDNAVNAMKEKGRIDISVQVVQDAVTVYFGDSGPGIPQEYQDRIFLPHFSTKHQGMGLGLAIVHRILEEHGATIAYLGQSPGGALFSLVFPLHRVPDSVREAFREVP